MKTVVGNEVVAGQGVYATARESVWVDPSMIVIYQDGKKITLLPPPGVKVFVDPATYGQRGFMEPAEAKGLQSLAGDWNLFAKEGHPAFIERVSDDGWVGEEGYSIAWYQNEGWEITPVAVVIPAKANAQ